MARDRNSNLHHLIEKKKVAYPKKYYLSSTDQTGVIWNGKGCTQQRERNWCCTGNRSTRILYNYLKVLYEGAERRKQLVTRGLITGCA